MTSTQIAPVTGEECQIFLQSPMTPSEKARKLAVEAKARAVFLVAFERILDQEECLFTIYQEGLFRGDHGGRTWAEYLKSGEPKELSFNAMTTDSAGQRICHFLGVKALRQWNEQNPGKALPIPQVQSALEGAGRLFDRDKGDISGGWRPYADNAADRFVRAVYDGVIKHKIGSGLGTKEEFQSILRAVKSDHVRPALTGTGGLVNMRGGTQPSNSSAESPDRTYAPRTADPAVLEAAERAKAEREAAAERQALRDREDREQGIDPRSLQTMEKPEMDVVREAETFATLTNALSDAAQALEVWTRGKLNAYGSAFFDSMQEFALGINSAHGRLDQIRNADDRLQRIIELLESDIEPGDLTDPTTYQQEP